MPWISFFFSDLAVRRASLFVECSRQKCCLNVFALFDLKFHCLMCVQDAHLLICKGHSDPSINVLPHGEAKGIGCSPSRGNHLVFVHVLETIVLLFGPFFSIPFCLTSSAA